MGANISTVEDNKAYVAPLPTTTSHAVINPKYHHNYNNNPSLNNNTSSNFPPETKKPAQAASTPSLTHSYPKPSTNNNNSKSKLPPSAALLPSSNALKSHRVIYFHSSQSCRGYLEASKVSNTLIVIDFTNGWCGRCRYMEPTLHELAAKFANVEFLKIDVDELYDISREYGVQKTPTFFLMRKGKLLDKVAGANKEELQMKIEKHRV